MTFQLSVSFQGGGSFLATMIPVAHALSDAAKNNHIVIEGAAGSSAGAVAAALIASNADFDALREYCHKGLLTDAKRVAGPYYHGVKRRQIAIAAVKAVLGFDLISPRKLEKFFESIFEAAKVELSRNDADLDLSHFPIDGHPTLSITRSGMLAGEVEFPVQGKLMSLLVDSCAIPILLRNFRTATAHPYVDGGLCENLPISGFDLEGESVILAVTVDDEMHPEGRFSLLNFPLALFSTAVSNNVKKSKQIVGKIMTVEEKAEFSFHQISKAVEWISNDDNYKKTYDRTMRKILDLASYHTHHHRDGKFVNSRDTKAARDNHLKSLLKNYHTPEHYEISKVELRVNADSLLNPDPNSYARMDIVTSASLVKICEAPLAFYKSYIPLLDGHFHPVTWRVLNVSRSNTRVLFTPFHYHDANDGGDNYDPCFIRFDTPEADFSLGDELRVECIYAVPSSMMELATKDKEFLSFHNSHNSALPLEIILIYPSYLGKLEFEEKEKKGKTSPFEVLSGELLAGRLGADALSLSIAGVKSSQPIEADGWLSVWVKRST